MEHSKRKHSKNEELEDDFIDEIVSDDEIDVSDKGLLVDEYPTDQFGGKDYTKLKPKPDEPIRPIFVSPDGYIYFETFNFLSKITQEFLITIAEPVSRPENIHTYKLTPTSLYAAVSGGLKSDEILRCLRILNKTELPPNIESFIKTSTSHYGKANLVLRDGRMIIESKQLKHLQFLIADYTIRQCLLQDETGKPIIKTECENVVEISNPFNNEMDKDDTDLDPSLVDFYKSMDMAGEDNADKLESEIELLKKGGVAYSVEIIESQLETVKKQCIELKSTLLSEYDFRNDTSNPDIKMDLKPSTSLRPYQEKSLSKMFGHNRARSGIIVLPCGAGKTLVGVTAACTIRKRCIVFTTGAVAVDQWRNHFIQYTTIDEKKVCRFTGSTKDTFVGTDVFIATYNIIGYSGKRSDVGQNTIAWIKKQSWGLIILDEVHTIPAKTFRSVLQVIHGHCMLGLTATLLREDDKIGDLNFLVGPKLYEADWMELTNKGYIARVQCVDVRCTMPPEFYKEYLKAEPARKMLLYVMNPEKIRRCEYLIKYHEKRGDKIIVISDNLFALQYYANSMKKLYMMGDTHHDERMYVMKNFRENPNVNTIFVSKMADVALDLPEATVLIQISSQGGSRRQEAQRLGRVTRAKKGMNPDQVNAYFYTLVSADTNDQLFSSKRQKFLKDQGYAFKIVTELAGMDKEDLMLSTKASQLKLLEEVLQVQEKDCDVERLKTKNENERKKPKEASVAEKLSASMSKKRKHLTENNQTSKDTMMPIKRR